ncbi:selenocysteine-specific translation elongation factor [candidate division GN15 bacterium]|uniref:Selenocysteine-specific elongation factor n=1 Tax=candidate division GN15 bacterium TaxID=2072418 RepID=A0A855WW90_9BACT|nr:MAG: selenocysteine-specific translation elongation factor [candidate division GN15 bacterium]
MIVVGTAGHIDHGKSSIVKRLTGTDPDRLPEEKARGMTIDLGFAFLKTQGGEDIAFVDVPGHERFVKNMIAGAGGVDVVMLVVAADDGWMPQSQEHFEIIKLLGINSGFVVINKIDLAESDWLEVLKQDITERIKGSCLDGSPIFECSAQTGAGFDLLAAHLNQLPHTVQTRKDYGKARLYIDRSFVRPGIGGVVTGSLRGGKLSVGQTVTVWPSLKHARIRSLQTHNEDLASVSPGHRTAVSLTGIDKEDLQRGGVISDSQVLPHLRENQVFALSVELVKEAPVAIEDRRRVLVMLGTTEVEGEIRLFDRAEIKPSSQGIAFFKPEEPLYGLVGDRFIVRLPTPAVTLGGGVVLDQLPKFPRRRDLDDLSYLRTRTSGRLGELVKSELLKSPLVRETDCLVLAYYSSTEIGNEIALLVTSGGARRFKGWVFDVERMKLRAESFKHDFEAHVSDKSHVKGLLLEQIRPLLHHDLTIADVLLEYFVSEGVLQKVGDKYDLAGRGMTLKGVVKEAHDRILSELKAQPFTPPTLPTLAAGGKIYQEAIRFMIESGEVYKCGSDFLFLTESWNEIAAFIRSRLASDSRLAVSDLKDRFGITRKFAIPILEETDRIGLTRREGDFRVRGDRFEK